MARHGLPLLTFLALVALAVRFPPTPPPDDPLVVMCSDAGFRVGGRAVDERTLRARLAAHADRERDETHPYRPSESRVLVRVATGTRWEPVWRVLRACSAPEVRIWRVRLELAGSVPPLDLPLDRDRMVGYSLVRIPEVPTVEFDLKRDPGQDQTRIVLMERPLGVDDAGFEVLEDQLGQIRRGDPEVLPASLDAWSSVPVEDVARAVRILIRTGYLSPAIAGAPPESWRAEELREAAWTLPREEIEDCVVEALGSVDPLERAMAARIFGTLGAPTIPLLVRALDAAVDARQVRELRAAARRVMTWLGPEVDLRDLLAAIVRAERRVGRVVEEDFYD